MDGGIADLFRVQKASMDAQNPMSPEIGASTSLPPQLLQLVKQSVANQQAEMRMGAQAAQTQQQPTVADTIRQKSAALMQRQQQQAQSQQEAVQQLMKAQQQPIRFEEGGLVTDDPDIERMRDLQGAQERYKRAGSDTSGIDQALAHLFESMRDKQMAKYYKGRPSPEAPRASGIEVLAEAVTPTSAKTDNERREGAERTARPKVNPAGGIVALKQAIAPDADPATPSERSPTADAGPWAKAAQGFMNEQAPSEDERIAKTMALRQQYGPKGLEEQFLRDQMARREAEIEKTGAERPGITQLLTAMARAARNDPKGGWGAGLLGAAEFSQATAAQRKAKVAELQQAKDLLLQSLAKLQDAKASGDLQAVVSAQAEAQKYAQDLATKKGQMATTMGSQEMQNQGADSRLGRELTSREREGAADRASREKTAAAANAATIKAAGMRQGGDNDMSKRYDRAVDNAQKRLDTVLKTPQGMMLAPDKIDALRARVLREEMAALGLSLPTGLQSAGPATGASGGMDLSQWGKPQVVK